WEYAGAAEKRGLQVLIAGAGGAAHLPGMAAAKTVLPVLGVPVESRVLHGVDSLLSIVQMPAGVPVGTLAIGQAGAVNAALLAARRLGYRVHAFDPTDDCPAGQVADVEVSAAYDDLEAARRFAAGVDVVTFEFENIPAETLAAVAQSRPVFPSPEVLHVCRHR